MSKGTRVFTVRIPEELADEAIEAITRRNIHSRETPWVLSDFIRIALAEKLAKMERSRKGQRKFSAGPVDEWKAGDYGSLTLPGIE